MCNDFSYMRKHKNFKKNPVPTIACTGELLIDVKAKKGRGTARSFKSAKRRRPSREKTGETNEIPRCAKKYNLNQTIDRSTIRFLTLSPPCSMRSLISCPLPSQHVNSPICHDFNIFRSEYNGVYHFVACRKCSKSLCSAQNNMITKCKMLKKHPIPQD